MEAGNKLVKSTSGSLTSMIIFMTDGQPTVGDTDRYSILNKITTLNREQNFAIHCLAFGKDADYKLLQQISMKNKGVSRKIYEDDDASLQLIGLLNNSSDSSTSQTYCIIF